MAILDDIRALEKQVVDRLRELEPALSEYQELRALAERLGLDYKPDGNAAKARQPRKRTAAPRRAPARTQRRRVTPPGQREQQVLAALAERPGQTVPELGKTLGVDYTGLYRVVRRLQESGQIRKRGSKVMLAEKKPS